MQTMSVEAEEKKIKKHANNYDTRFKKCIEPIKVFPSSVPFLAMQKAVPGCFFPKG